MNLLYQLFKFYINSSLHVAFAVGSFTVITCINFNISIDYSLLLFVFSSTVVAYNFVKYYTLFKSLKHSLSLKFIQVLSFLFLLIVIVCMFYLNMQSLVLFIILGVFTLLYSLPFLPQTKNLRDISGLKIFIIAFVWTGTTVLSPFFEQGLNHKLIETDLIWYTLSRFFLIIALTIPFEIRDHVLDSDDLKTLPQLVGVKSSKLIGGLLCVISLLCLNLGAGHIVLIELLLYIMVIIFITFTSTTNSVYYTSFWVESIPIFWLLFNFCFNNGQDFSIL